ncbi:MAG: hypothetical protein VYE68_04360 [Acidobacteriota bacterium]|nr:hypothetical protein [Acidobacteriota bacterium]
MNTSIATRGVTHTLFDQSRTYDGARASATVLAAGLAVKPVGSGLRAQTIRPIGSLLGNVFEPLTDTSAFATGP